MRIKGLKTKNLFFDFRHKDEGNTIKLHFHLKSKKNGKKAFGEKVGGLIVSKSGLQDIHVGKKYLQYFDEVYKSEKDIVKYAETYLEKAKKYLPDDSEIEGFEIYSNESHKEADRLEKVYIEFLHPNGDDSIAFKFYIKEKEGFINIGHANISPRGFKELHLETGYGIYFGYIYGQKDNLVRYAKKCNIKNTGFVRKIKVDTQDITKKNKRKR